MQLPPIHSAIKQKGKPVYLLARQGKEVTMEPRKIVIREFEITEIDLPVISFKIVCTTGTYIRSLANDFGQALGCGAYLSGLCRTRIGSFLLENAITVDEFVDSVVKLRKAGN
jgi:tRNA pseudouridine55 synthase